MENINVIEQDNDEFLQSEIVSWKFQDVAVILPCYRRPPLEAP